MGWIRCNQPIIYYLQWTDNSKRNVLYYQTAGDCHCKLDYDGQAFLLINLDGKHLFHYGLLYHYLHLMVEGRNPLAAFSRSLRRDCYTLLGQSSLAPSYHVMRKAWLAFIYRITDSLNPQSEFCCDICGANPNIISLDCMTLGDLIMALKGRRDEESSFPTLFGSAYHDRVCITSKYARNKLTQLAKSCDKRDVNKLTCAEYATMCGEIAKSNVPSLVPLLDECCSILGGVAVPQQLARPLINIARASSCCGLMQAAGTVQEDRRTQEILAKFCGGEILMQSDNQHLQRHVPVVLEFISACLLDNQDGSVPEYCRKVVQEMVCCMMAPFMDMKTRRIQEEYPPPLVDSLMDDYAFFPNLPQCRGVPKYQVDVSRRYKANLCHKKKKGHQSLSPGILTTYCPHGISYGFQVLQDVESPKIPFEMMVSRFKEPPRYIIYDNACNLHEYVLNREPRLFRNSIFLVDRFHWFNHSGCSDGYCIDKYKNKLLANLNTQVNEQGHAGLIRLKSQLSYMKPANFIRHVLFLTIKNRSKRISRDIVVWTILNIKPSTQLAHVFTLRHNHLVFLASII